ncbi:hypothetical protein ACEUZ9_001114 [Paracoccus litorisediminis]|uniref:hypothetical protein n=1 Tax=Paracoccus litorisediminis TaxID=2006130 RepID=UPI00372FE70B
MKTTIQTILASCALAALAAPAMAATAANTLITTTVDISYSSGGTTVNIPSAATASFVVDRKVDALASGLNAGQKVNAATGAQTVTLTFEVENTGNDTEGFDIDIASTASGSVTPLIMSPTATTTRGQFYVVISNNATPGAGTEIPYNPTGTVNARDLAAEGKLWVHLRANIPVSAVNGDVYSFNLSATALEPGTTTPYAASGTGTLAGLDTVIVGGAANLVATTSQDIEIDAPVLTATKTVKVLDNGLGTFDCATGPVPAPNNIAALPGSCVLYTITLSNADTATVAASGVVMNDVLPATLDYVNSAAGDFDTVTWSSGTRTVSASLSTLAIDDSASFTIRAKIVE